MKSSLVIDHKEMHDIKSAAEIIGYSRDHITSLARAKKIVAAQVGRQWYVDVDSLKQYASVTTLEQQVRQKHLSEDRKTQKEFAQKISDAKVARSKSKTRNSKRTKEAVVAMAVVMFVVAGALSVAGEELLARAPYLAANTKLAAAEQSSLSDTPLVVGMEAAAETTFNDGTVEVSRLAASEEAIVLLPELAAASSTIFSDEVTIVRQENGMQVIVPVGRPASEGVPFATVPISEVPKL